MSSKGGKEVKKPKEPKVVEPEEEQLPKEYWEIRISDLEEKLRRTKKLLESVQQENEQLKKDSQRLSVDKMDIVEYLQSQVTEKETEILHLEDRLKTVESEAKQAIERAQQESEEKLHAYKEELDELNSKATKYKLDLDDLLDFKAKKSSLEKALLDMQALIEQKEKEFKELTHQMEKKYVQDKNRMKKDMLAKVNEVVVNFRKLSDKQMAETTKRAIRENMAVTAQLSRMSSKTIDLISQNEALTNQKKALQRKVDLLEMSEAELIRNSQGAGKVVKMLVDKVKHHENTMEKAKVEIDEEKKRWTFEGEENTSIIEQQQQRLSEMQEELENTQHTQIMLETSLAAVKKEVLRNRSLLTDLVSTLVKVLAPTYVESIDDESLKSLITVAKSEETTWKNEFEEMERLLEYFIAHPPEIQPTRPSLSIFDTLPKPPSTVPPLSPALSTPRSDSPGASSLNLTAIKTLLSQPMVPLTTLTSSGSPEALRKNVTATLLGPVRAWGKPSKCLPRKGLGMYYASPLTTITAPPIVSARLVSEHDSGETGENREDI